MFVDDLGPFDVVLDVGGNVGEFAELAKETWPGCRLTSFEPIPRCAEANERRAQGRWLVERCAVTAQAGPVDLHICVNQHSASTIMEPGTVRRERFRIRDSFETRQVAGRPLDDFLSLVQDGDRLLVKIDVEGAELGVIEGGRWMLEQAAVVLCEVNQDPGIFLGAPSPEVVDAELRKHGLYFCGIYGVQLDPEGVAVQFDGCWRR